MPNLILMCGCPGSGKTTWVSNNINSEKDVHISRDTIRFSLLKDGDKYFDREKQVFNYFVKEIQFWLKEGYSVYADATHLNVKSRQKLINRIPRVLYEQLHAVFINTPLETALEQNRNRKGTKAFVPEEQLQKMFYSIDPPTYREGFDVIKEIKKEE